MFEEMTEQQAREQILEMTKELLRKISQPERNRMRKVTGSRMRPVCTMRTRW